MTELHEEWLPELLPALFLNLEHLITFKPVVFYTLCLWCYCPSTSWVISPKWCYICRVSIVTLIICGLDIFCLTLEWRWSHAESYGIVSAGLVVAVDNKDVSRKWTYYLYRWMIDVSCQFLNVQPFVSSEIADVWFIPPKIVYIHPSP